jgi:conjugal transfer/entry exclusion protein
MKKFIALALVTLGISVPARAQWIVFDPTMNVQSILNTAQEVAKFVEMINNQVFQFGFRQDGAGPFSSSA